MDNFLTQPIFGDPEIAEIFSSGEIARNLLNVEGALAKAQAGLGIVPDDTAVAIAEACAALSISESVLTDGATASGVPVPVLVKALREAVGAPHDDWVHWGATSQDIIDSAMSLCYSKALDILGQRLSSLLDSLQFQSQKYSTTLMAARTRSQLATPTTFGLRIAQWAQPLIGCEAEMPEVRSKALRVQFGGASGNQSAVAPHGPMIAMRLAEELGLTPCSPWHTDRSGIRTLSSWLAKIVSALGKIAGDISILSRSEIAEASAGRGGSSSAMPHKSNPVTSEAILSLARVATAYEFGLATSAIHLEERDGANWSVEWRLLPELIITCGSALNQSEILLENLTANVDHMHARLDATPEMMAESAVQALSKSIGRQKAQKIVAQALSSPSSFIDGLLESATDLDWLQINEPSSLIEASKSVVSGIFQMRQTHST
jgi:3-carboxy-cis,cis-muconate cycloisomerase